MKKILMAGASCAALALGGGQASAADLFMEPAEPAMAAAMPYVSMMLSIYGGGALGDSSDDSFDSDGIEFGGDARAAGQHWLFGVHGNWLDALDDDSDDDGDASTLVSVEGHFNANLGQAIVGGFISVAGSRAQSSDDGYVHFIPGVEALFNSGMWSFYGQAGGAFCTVSDDCSDTWENGIWGRLGARWFVSNQTKIEGDITLAGGKFDASSDDYGYGLGWGLEGEHQMMAGPFSFFAAYRGTYTEDSDCSSDCDVIDHAIHVGLRIRNEELYSSYTRGADRFSLPNHHIKRWVAFPDEL